MEEESDIRLSLGERRKRFEEIIRERPYAIQTIQMMILYDIAGMLEEQGKKLDIHTEKLSRIEGAIKSEHPRGFLGYKELVVTDELKEWEPPEYWFSGSLFNYGPNIVYVQVNDIALDFVPVRVNENLEFDFKTARIKKIYLKCDAGKTTEVKITGKY